MTEQTPQEQETRGVNGFDSEIRHQPVTYTGDDGERKVIKGEEYSYSKKILIEILTKRGKKMSDEEIRETVIRADKAVMTRDTDPEDAINILRGYYLGITDRAYSSVKAKETKEKPKEKGKTTIAVAIPSIKGKGRFKRFVKRISYVLITTAAAAGALFAGSEIRDYVEKQENKNKYHTKAIASLEQRNSQLEKRLNESCSTFSDKDSLTEKHLEAVNSRVSGLEQATKTNDYENATKISALEDRARKTREYAAGLLATISEIEAKDRETRSTLIGLNTQHKKESEKLRQELARQYEEATDKARKIEQEIKKLNDKYAELKEGLNNTIEDTLDNEYKIMLLEKGKKEEKSKETKK